MGPAKGEEYPVTKFEQDYPITAVPKAPSELRRRALADVGGYEMSFVGEPCRGKMQGVVCPNKNRRRSQQALTKHIAEFGF